MVGLHNAKAQTLLPALGSLIPVLGGLGDPEPLSALCSVNPRGLCKREGANVGKRPMVKRVDEREMRAGRDTAIIMYFTHEWQRSARLLCLDLQDQEGGLVLRTGRPDPASCSCRRP